MKLRQFLATVPMAAVALALPAEAEQCPAPYRPLDYRGWWSKVDWDARTAVFTAIERCHNGDSSNSEMKILDSPRFAADVRELEEHHSRWVARAGEHPFLIRHPAPNL